MPNKVVLTFVSLDGTLMCETIHAKDFDLVISFVSVCFAYSYGLKVLVC